MHIPCADLSSNKGYSIAAKIMEINVAVTTSIN